MKKFVTVSVVVLLVLVMSGVVLAQEANSPENQAAAVYYIEDVCLLACA